MAAKVEQREVLFSGRVQGVGFRYTVQNISRKYQVTGFVKNLADGRVQLVAEGEADELERFVGEVEKRMGSYIRDAQSRTGPATGEFQEFGIRY